MFPFISSYLAWAICWTMHQRDFKASIVALANFFDALEIGLQDSRQEELVVSNGGGESENSGGMAASWNSGSDDPQ
ncbi:hypothetical protein NL676_028789 [Syzygium grande]|nr:hypothetical protein NL676_028789 [Syzygium grande]